MERRPGPLDTPARRRKVGAATMVALASAVLLATQADAACVGGGPQPRVAAAAKTCTARMLVLAALPAEISKLLAEATLDPSQTVVIDGRSFYLGTLRGTDVVLAMSGIGLVNAARTTQTALDHFRCGSRPGISGIVFSGTSGGRTYIGDVTVPARYTENGTTWLRADAAMLATVRDVVASGSVRLERAAPLGDPACACQNPDAIKTVSVSHAPQIIVGGDGLSSDPFGGRAWPCIPGGGDVFGCVPCRAPNQSAPDASRFVSGVLPFADPNFFFSYRGSPSPPQYDADDMETAAVARVATKNGVPWIAFRSLSDGKGDRLMLPGFPAQYFVYRQLAADNAATLAGDFLQAWAARQSQSGASMLEAAQGHASTSSAPSPAQQVQGLPNTASAGRSYSLVLGALPALVALCLGILRRTRRVRVRATPR